MPRISREDHVGDEEQLHEKPAQGVRQYDREDHACCAPFAFAHRLAAGAAKESKHQAVENDDDGQRKRVEKDDEAEPVEASLDRKDLNGRLDWRVHRSIEYGRRLATVHDVDELGVVRHRRESFGIELQVAKHAVHRYS